LKKEQIREGGCVLNNGAELRGLYTSVFPDIGEDAGATSYYPAVCGGKTFI
jgi:hypothetical protein